MKKNQPDRFAKYRGSQSNKGLIRFEIQVQRSIKEDFDKMAHDLAEQYDEPWDIRQRLSKAKTQLFEEFTNNIKHEFTALKEKNKIAEDKIAFLTQSLPDFSNAPTLLNIDHRISSLPDDSKSLKNVIERMYRQLQKSALEAEAYKRKAHQYIELYEALQDHTI
jgi:hypothetical protein